MVPLPTKPVLRWLHGEDTKHNISLHCALVKWMHLSPFMTTELVSQLITDSAPNQCNPRISVLDIPRISDTVKSSVITHDTQVHFFLLILLPKCYNIIAVPWMTQTNHWVVSQMRIAYIKQIMNSVWEFRWAIQFGGRLTGSLHFTSRLWTEILTVMSQYVYCTLQIQRDRFPEDEWRYAIFKSP